MGGPNPCGSSSGSFEVRDIGRVGLQITRLSVVFTRWCEDGGVDIGQLQLGYPQTTYNVSPKVVDWPWSTVYPGQAAPENHPVNVRLTSSKTVTVSQPRVTGAEAADFPIRKQNCTGKPYSVTATMRFHETADRTPPGPVTGLKAVRSGSQLRLAWTKPAAADLAGIIICWYAGTNAPSAWSAGNTAYLGTGTSATFAAPSNQHVSISIWTYDKTGNISTPSILHLS